MALVCHLACNSPAQGSTQGSMHWNLPTMTLMGITYKFCTTWPFYQPHHAMGEVDQVMSGSMHRDLASNVGDAKGTQVVGMCTICKYLTCLYRLRSLLSFTSVHFLVKHLIENFIIQKVICHGTLHYCILTEYIHIFCCIFISSRAQLATYHKNRTRWNSTGCHRQLCLCLLWPWPFYPKT